MWMNSVMNNESRFSICFAATIILCHGLCCRSRWLAHTNIGWALGEAAVQILVAHFDAMAKCKAVCACACVFVCGAPSYFRARLAKVANPPDSPNAIRLTNGPIAPFKYSQSVCMFAHCRTAQHVLQLVLANSANIETRKSKLDIWRVYIIVISECEHL